MHSPAQTPTHSPCAEQSFDGEAQLSAISNNYFYLFIFPFGIKQLQFWVWVPFFFTCCADQQGARSVHQQLQASARLFLPNYFI